MPTRWATSALPIHPAGSAPVVGTGWKVLKIGAGGYITGISISADGTTKVIRTDTYGGYRLVGGTTWAQLVTADSMPAGDLLPNSGIGVYEVTVAPSDSTRVYMAWKNTVYRSNNGGVTFTATSLTGKTWDANTGEKLIGPKMAVDPINPDVVYFGVLSDSLYVTINGGTSWNTVSTAQVPAAGNMGYSCMWFDPSGGTTGGRTKNLFVSSHTHGLYRTTDAGTTFTHLTGGPADSKLWQRAALDTTNGVLHCVVADSLTTNAFVWRFTPPSSWVQTTTVADYGPLAIAINPANHLHVVFQRSAGEGIAQTQDAGNTWDYTWIYSATWTSPDVAWLINADRAHAAGSDMVFDPVVANKVWIAEGVAPWTASVIYGAGAAVAYSSVAAGIEQLVINRIIKPPGGSVLVATWDRATFKLDDLTIYPSTYKPTTAFDATWDIDYAGGTPLFIVGNHGDNQGNSLDAGYSQDGGNTWTTFPAMPLGAVSPYTYGFGGMAVSTDTQHIVWCGQPNQWPYYSANRGTAWNKCVIPALIDPTDAAFPRSVWGYAYQVNRHVVCADKVTSNVLYFHAKHPTLNAIVTVNGSTGITLVPALGDVFVAGDVGRTIIGNNIPASTTIASVTDSTHAVMSNPANGSSTTGGLAMIVGGFYKSVDGGINWALAGPSLAVRADNSPGTVGQALYWANFNASLQSVPGQAGHLWFTGGPVGANPDSLTPDGYAFIRSVDGGVTWTIPNANVLEVYCFGFGAGSGAYPAIFIIGWVSGVYGVWRSDDQAATWTNIGTWPLSSIDWATTITGDMDIYGRCYVGFRGSGCAYRDLS